VEAWPTPVVAIRPRKAEGEESGLERVIVGIEHLQQLVDAYDDPACAGDFPVQCQQATRNRIEA
jgi:hypothetical protein